MGCISQALGVQTAPPAQPWSCLLPKPPCPADRALQCSALPEDEVKASAGLGKPAPSTTAHPLSQNHPSHKAKSSQRPWHHRDPLVGSFLTHQPTTTDGHGLQQVQKLPTTAVWTNQPIPFPPDSISVGFLHENRPSGAENTTRADTSRAPAPKPRLLAPCKAFAARR